MGGTIGELAGSLGGRALAVAIVFVAAFKFLRWLAEFVFARVDVNRSALGKRLMHVEIELDAYREATFLLLGAIAKLAPDNPVLATASQILRKIPPRQT
jgi:hypothetical protein